MPSGSLVALAAKGAADLRLTYKPQVTCWKSCYKRHTNFAIQTQQVVMNGNVAFGGTTNTTIQRNGDLASRTYLVMDIQKVADGRPRDGDQANVIRPPLSILSTPAAAIVGDANKNVLTNVYSDFTDNVRHTQGIGHMAIDTIEFNLGGTSMDVQTGYDMAIMEDLCTAAKRELGELAGYYATDTDAINHTAETPGAIPVNNVRYYVPLHFWWSKAKRRDQALPLIGLQYHSAAIKIRFNPRNSLVRFHLDSGSGIAPNQFAAGVYGAATYADGWRNFNCNEIASPGGLGTAFPLAPWRSVAAATQLTTGGQTNNGGYFGLDLQDAYFLVEYVALDTRERKAFSCKCLEYLVTQIQSQLFSNISASSASISQQINFNHPVIYLSYFLQRQCERDQNNWLIWDGNNLALPLYNIGPVATGNADSPTPNYWYFGPRLRSTDAMSQAKLSLNSNDLSDYVAGDARWLRLANPRDYGAYEPSLYFYTMPFGLCICDASDNCCSGRSPSGSINFSRIDNITLNIQLRQNQTNTVDVSVDVAGYNALAVAGSQITVSVSGDIRHLYVHAMNYNYLKVAAGMGGLLFAS